MPARQPADPLAALAEAARNLPPDTLARFAASLNEADLDVLEHAIGASLATGWLATPATLAAHIDPTYHRWRYIDLLASRFRDAVHGSDRFQQWNLPSQYGKTTLLHWCCVWLLAHRPHWRIIYISHGRDLAVSLARQVRDTLEANPSLGVQLRPDLRAAGEWRTVQGGGLYAAGIAGGITGRPGECVLVDDLFKNWQAAHSERTRETTWATYVSSVRMRLQPGGVLILNGTRWHVDDHFARALQRAATDNEADPFTVTALPALAVDNDPLGREPGEPLEPERFDRAEVLARAAALGSYLAAALEQQAPAPEEGGEIERGWWRWSDQPPAQADAWCSSWDTKMKDREAGDYVVGQVWGRAGSAFHMVDQLRGQWSQAITRVALALVHVRHPYIRTHYVEAAGWGPELRRELTDGEAGYTLRPEVADRLGVVGAERDAVEALVRRGVPNVVGSAPKGSKAVRLRAVSGKIEAGNVYLPTWVPSATVLVDEAAAFPNGAHDDTLDAMSQALARLDRGSGRITTPAGVRLPVRTR